MRGSSRAALYNGLWLIGMIAVALVVGGYITSKQRIHVPAWVPVIGQHRFVLNAEVEDAAGIMPGQGQMVTVSGIPVGEIRKVTLKNGKAVLRLDIKERYAHIHRDATILLRPKTGLKDMIAELDPGTKGPELRAAPRSAAARPSPTSTSTSSLPSSTPTRATRSCCWSAARARRSATATAMTSPTCCGASSRSRATGPRRPSSSGSDGSSSSG